jgi:hypothetical protein
MDSVRSEVDRDIWYSSLAYLHLVAFAFLREFTNKTKQAYNKYGMFEFQIPTSTK